MACNNLASGNCSESSLGVILPTKISPGLTKLPLQIIPSLSKCWTSLAFKLGMFLVVSFSSSLDIAAIEMELGKSLDYNKEIETVGISNFISGLFGGYTGSYIFSQTIFLMRRNINNRICGYLIVLLELIVVFLPISITSYLPKFFFGSLLILIATDLMYEWLVSWI